MKAKYKIDDWVYLKGEDVTKFRLHILAIREETCDAGIQVFYICRPCILGVGWNTVQKEIAIRQVEIAGKTEEFTAYPGEFRDLAWVEITGKTEEFTAKG